LANALHALKGNRTKNPWKEPYLKKLKHTALPVACPFLQTIVIIGKNQCEHSSPTNHKKKQTAQRNQYKWLWGHMASCKPPHHKPQLFTPSNCTTLVSN
jgi:hypothetical protein